MLWRHPSGALTPLQLKIQGQGQASHRLACQLTQDKIGRLLAHLVIGDLYRRQGRITGLRHIRIIETGDGQLITFLPVFLLPVLGDLGFANTTFSNADFGVVGTYVGPDRALMPPDPGSQQAAVYGPRLLFAAAHPIDAENMCKHSALDRIFSPQRQHLTGECDMLVR